MLKFFYIYTAGDRVASVRSKRGQVEAKAGKKGPKKTNRRKKKQTRASESKSRQMGHTQEYGQGPPMPEAKAETRW